MIFSEPREMAQKNILVTGGSGSIVYNLSGYLDAILWDVPGAETYYFSIKGPTGIEYFIQPTVLTGDTTVNLLPAAVPMTGVMTISVFSASGDGLFKCTPVGRLK